MSPSMLSLSRRGAVFGLPALAAIPALAAKPLPSDNPAFWCAIERYGQVCAHMRAHRDVEDDAVHDADFDALEEAAAEVLRIPAHGATEALVLLTLVHHRMYGPLAGVERGMFGEIERLNLEQELSWTEQDRAFLEKGIAALKGSC